MGCLMVTRLNRLKQTPRISLSGRGTRAGVLAILVVAPSRGFRELSADAERTQERPRIPVAGGPGLGDAVLGDAVLGDAVLQGPPTAGTPTLRHRESNEERHEL